MRFFIRNIIIALSGIALTCTASGADRPLALNTPAQIQNWVKQAVKAHQKSSTLAEWKLNSIHPHVIFSQIFSETQNAEIHKLRIEALCHALQSIVTESLVTFDEDLENPLLPCGADLKQRLSNHWAGKSAQLEGFHKSTQAMKELNLLAPCGRKLKVLKPTIDRPVDIAKAPYFVTGNLPEKQVALTFDDGPHPTRSLRILKTLVTRGQRANYFQVGQNAKTWPGISKELSDSQQVVGSHSMTHRNLASLNYQDATDEIRNGDNAVEGATGISIPFFRFPYGASTSALKRFLKEEQVTGFFWNIDSLDWKIKDPVQLFTRVVQKLKQEKRGIMLFHDIHEQTAIAIPHILEELDAQGFQTVVFVPAGS